MRNMANMSRPKADKFILFMIALVCLTSASGCSSGGDQGLGGRPNDPTLSEPPASPGDADSSTRPPGSSSPSSGPTPSGPAKPGGSSAPGSETPHANIEDAMTGISSKDLVADEVKLWDGRTVQAPAL